MKKGSIKKHVILLILIGLAGIGTTTAYFTVYDAVENRVLVGRNVTEIIENFPGPTPTPAGDHLNFKKEVYITNQSEELLSNVPCYVRAMVSFSNYDIGKAVTLLGMDRERWVYNEADGYYYYKSPLAAGQSTTALFTGFSVKQSEIDKQYLEQLNDFQINVYEESIQKGDFNDYQSAWNYYLYPLNG